MKKLLLIVLVLIAVLVGCNIELVDTKKVPNTHQTMSVHFIDVGQGDAIFIQSPNGKTMLVDGGVKGAGQTIIDYLRDNNVTSLDYVVATHPDADHIGGLIPVLQTIPIGHFIDSGKVHTSKTYEEMLMLINEKDIPYSVPTVGEQIDLDGAIETVVVHSDEEAVDNNDASIVLRLVYGDISFLLTGDAGINIEKQLLDRDIRSTILKAGHHGSNTSTSLDFIKAVQPEVMILSYGQNNQYGHPHAEVVENARAVNSKIYATSEAGTIVVKTDGQTYSTTAAQFTGIGATSSVTPNKQATATTRVEIISKDLIEEVVVIQNTGSEAVSLKGWQLVSVEGHQLFNFPNIVLQPTKKLNITSGANAYEDKHTLKWTKRQIWANSGDKAQLLNAKGEIVSELD